MKLWKIDINYIHSQKRGFSNVQVQSLGTMSPNQDKIYQTHPFAQKLIHQNSPALQRFFSAGKMGESSVDWVLK